eukprot:c13723_g1_i1.p1 GENE.c13723_g1_i1~~c13723_g1_i1.p1  ORF type:complete len:467 (-),score=72.72 c13723_g1_i1:870-2270(-)
MRVLSLVGLIACACAEPRQKHVAVDAIGNQIPIDVKSVYTPTPEPPELPKQPQNAETLLAECSSLHRAGHVRKALETIMPVLKVHSDWTAGHFYAGIFYRALGMYSESALHNEEVLRLDPNNLAALVNGGISFENLRQREKARRMYERAIAIHPNFFEGHNSLAILDYDEGNIDSARLHWSKCLSVRDDPAIRIKLAMMLPSVFPSRQAVDTAFKNYKTSLDALLAGHQSNKQPLRVSRDAYNAIGTNTFYLAYLGFPDIKAHMSSVYHVMRQADPDLLFVSPHLARLGFGPGESLWQVKQKIKGGGVISRDYRGSGKLRVGVISMHLRGHSVGKLTRGFKYLPRDRIELIVVFPGQTKDEISNQIQSAADRVVSIPKQLKAARDTISDLKLHLLLFMDIGMESFCYFLAFSRLAPIQALTHGHPATSGIPTVDYFVSFKMYEPSHNQVSRSEMNRENAQVMIFDF